MNRLPNWRSRLFNYIDECHNKEFKYGKFDCCLFGASIVEAQTGIDLAANYRGKYRTLMGGLKLLKGDGYSSYIDFLTNNFTELEAVAFAQVGDLAIVETDEGAAICAIMGSFAVGLSQSAGLSKFDISQVSKVFRV